MRKIVSVFASLCAPFAFVAACDEGAPEAGATGPIALGWEAPNDDPHAARAAGIADAPAKADPVRSLFAPTEPHAPLDPLDPADNLPYLMSRFGPSQGAADTHIRILTAFDPSGCSADGTCAVTIGGQDVPIADDDFLLEVVVPRWARTGPLCVTWHARTECGEDFTMLDAALIYEMTPGHVSAGAGDTTIELSGDGFMEDSMVLFGAGWSPVVTTVHSAYKMTAVVPASALATAGTHLVTVYSPSSGRCGAQSAPQEFFVR